MFLLYYYYYYYYYHYIIVEKRGCDEKGDIFLQPKLVVRHR